MFGLTTSEVAYGQVYFKLYISRMYKNNKFGNGNVIYLCFELNEVVMH